MRRINNAIDANMDGVVDYIETSQDTVNTDFYHAYDGTTDLFKPTNPEITHRLTREEYSKMFKENAYDFDQGYNNNLRQILVEEEGELVLTIPIKK